MNANKLAIPLLAFAGGAILGRVLGLRTLVRGAMTAAAVTGMAAQPMIGANGHSAGRTRRRKPTQRAAHRRSAHKKSAAT